MAEATKMANSLSSNNSNQLVKVPNAGMTVFKRPQSGSSIVRHKKKPKILSEERYIEEMSKIIQRDFFPDLERLRVQNEYLDAEARRDFLLMSELRARYSMSSILGPGSRRRQHNRNNNTMSPATFETPISRTPRNSSLTPKPVQPDETPQSISSEQSSAEGGHKQDITRNISLDGFLQHYTSEDNQSFQEIIETAEAKLRQKYALFYDEEQKSAMQLQQALTLPSIEQQFDAPDPQRKIETWTYTNMNSVMYVPDGVDLTEEEKVQAAERRQSIQHSATRLPTTLHGQTSKETSEVTGTLAADATATPRIRGHELLRSPSPRPGEAFSPIMTWGEIDGTPFRLDGGDTPLRNTPGPSFRINENSRRENIAIALAEKVSEKMRNHKQQALDKARSNIGSPFMRLNMERLASMSPAAQRLATGKLGLRSTPLMLTPSPMQQRRRSVSVKRKTTPSMVSNTPTTIPAKSSTGKPLIDMGSTITDDLLKIPTKRRATAADFF